MAAAYIAILIGSLISNPIVEFQDNEETELAKSATQAYVHCLLYHAVRGDDGTAKVDMLVSAVRHKCRIENAVWQTFLRVSLEKNGIPDDEIDITTDIMEDHLKKSATETVDRILSDIRMTQGKDD